MKRNLPSFKLSFSLRGGGEKVLRIVQTCWGPKEVLIVVKMFYKSDSTVITCILVNDSQSWSQGKIILCC